MASIEKRSKNTYRLVVEAGYDSQGKRIKRTKTIKATTKKEAEKELAKFLIEVESGDYIAPEKMNFAQFVENEWLEKFAKKELSPLTLDVYLSHIRKHILPAFGHYRLDQIKTLHVVSFINELSLSDSTNLYIYKVLKSVLNKAVEWKVIAKNPMDGVSQPKVAKKSMKFYDAEEAAIVIQALYQEPDVWRLYFLGAMLGGFRRGELLGLRWSDVHFDSGTISVRRSISLTKHGEAVVGSTKTEQSVGDVDMPAWYMDELSAYQKQWEQDKNNVGDRWIGGDYVFHSGFGKPYFHSTPTNTWKKFLTRHGLRQIRLHDLRHTAATLLIEAGVELKLVQERLRHSKYSTTADIYAHVTKRARKETAAALDQFDPKKSVPNPSPNPN